MKSFCWDPSLLVLADGQNGKPRSISGPRVSTQRDVAVRQDRQRVAAYLSFCREQEAEFQTNIRRCSGELPFQLAAKCASIASSEARTVSQRERMTVHLACEWWGNAGGNVEETSKEDVAKRRPSLQGS